MIFLSYSHQDKDFANPLSLILEAKGYKIWKDEKSLRATSGTWIRQIGKALQKCQIFLLILSEHSIKEDSFVSKEIDEALTQNKIIIPISRMPVPSLPDLSFLRSLQIIEFQSFSDDHYADKLNKIYKEINEIEKPKLPQTKTRNSNDKRLHEKVDAQKKLLEGIITQLDKLNTQLIPPTVNQEITLAEMINKILIEANKTEMYVDVIRLVSRLRKENWIGKEEMDELLVNLDYNQRYTPITTAS